MSCIACRGLNEQNLIRYYLDVHLKTGDSFYVYKLGNNMPLQVVKSSYFEEIYQKSIKPKLNEGAEYFHIQEFTRDKRT